MANRRELLTAVNLTVNTNRNNNAMHWIEHALQNIDPSTGEGFVLKPVAVLEGEPEQPQLSVEETIKRGVETARNNIVEKTTAINKVMEVHPEHVAKGLAVPIIPPLDMEYDATESKAICVVNESKFAVADDFIKLEELASVFKDYTYKVDKVFTPDDLPDAVNHANIANGVIDAMSMELKGLNEYTGEPHGRTPEQFDKLIKNRIFTAEVHLGKVSDLFEDAKELKAAVRYIKQYYKKKENLELAGYLDENIMKNISIRKARFM